MAIVGLVISITLAGNEPDLVGNTEHVRPPTNFRPVQNWFRRIAQTARQGLREFGFSLKGSVGNKMWARNR